jgi:hypothetical protein
MKLSMSHIASISWPIPEDRLSSERQNFYERVAIDFTDFGQSSAKVQMKKTPAQAGAFFTGPVAHWEPQWRLQAEMDCHSRHPHYGGGSDQHQKRLERRFGGFCHDDPRQIVVEKILFLIRHALGCGIFAF